MRHGRYDRAKLPRPPAQVAPTPIEVPPAGFFKHTFGADEDSSILLPNSVRENQIELIGGRNHRMVGGHLKGSIGYPEGTSMVRAKESSGSWTFEGLILDGNEKETDILNPCGSPGIVGPWRQLPAVYILNCLAKNCYGREEGLHADLCQPQGGVGWIIVDRFTAINVRHQGFFFAPQAPIAGVRITRADFAYGLPTDREVTYMLWFIQNGKNAKYDAYIGDTYVDMTQRPGQTLADDGVWPKAGTLNESGEAVGAIPVFDEGGAEIGVKFPPAARIHALDADGIAVRKGPRPAGHFVDESKVGLGYVPLGYV